MSNDIRDILQRLSIVEGKTTPVNVKHGLNQQQRSVPQLPALLKPKNISPTLTKKPYQAHPLDGYMVGETALNSRNPDEDLAAKRKALQDLEREPGHDKEAIRQRKLDLEKEAGQNGLAEAMQSVEEDMLSKVKRNFVDYLEKLEKENKVDRALVHKAKQELDVEDPTEEDVEEATWDADVAPVSGPEDAGDSEVAHGIEDHVAADVSQPAAPVATYEMAGGEMLECWGDDETGYELRRGGRSLPTRFKNRDEADIAVRLFNRRRPKPEQDLSQDYIEEK
jgi:hypothetical protein